MGELAATHEPTALGANLVTLVEGSSFCICEPNGDIRAGSAQGLYFRDTRLLDTWGLSVEGETLEPLLTVCEQPWTATFVGRPRVSRGGAPTAVLVRRDRFVGRGMREDLTLSNLGNTELSVLLALDLASDFADLFDDKGKQLPARPQITVSESAGLRLERRYGPHRSRGIEVCWPGAAVCGGRRLQLRGR